MPSEESGLQFTRHALQAVEERKIQVNWVEETIARPDLRTNDPEDEELERFFKRIPEYGGRVLRVVVNTREYPWRVVSAFFDSRMRNRL